MSPRSKLWTFARDQISANWSLESSPKIADERSKGAVFLGPASNDIAACSLAPPNRIFADPSARDKPTTKTELHPGRLWPKCNKYSKNPNECERVAQRSS